MGISFGIVLGVDASSDTSEEGRKEYLDFGGKVKSGGDLKAIVEGCILAIVEDMTDVGLILIRKPRKIARRRKRSSRLMSRGQITDWNWNPRTLRTILTPSQDNDAEEEITWDSEGQELLK
jgi:hypothetical protein